MFGSRKLGTGAGSISKGIAGSSAPRRTLSKWMLALCLILGLGIFTGQFDRGHLLAQDEHSAAENVNPSTTDAGVGSDESETEAELHVGGEEHSKDEEHVSHENVAAPLMAAIVVILLAAKVMGDVFERVGMPAVLGELSVGIILGNLALITSAWISGGWHGLDFLHAPKEHSIGDVYNTGAALKMLAEIGVVLLLFEVGLESNVKDMMQVGVSSLLVAFLGVVAPMILGVGAGWLLLGDEPWQVWLFLGATLCATSVGITARVLKDLGRSQQRESQIILGAAVIDDVMGLVILAVVTGIINDPEGLSAMSLLVIIGKSMGFLLAAVLLGTHLLVKPLFKAASFLRGHGLLVSTSLVICFGLAYLAALVELAPIVGAFAAGLILERAHYQELGKKEHVELEAALGPLTALLVPIFFVQMGIEVKLQSFADSNVWLLAGSLTAAAIIGKQVCSFGVLEKGLNKLAIGLGMIPRGEVGLIFASVGLTLKPINGVQVVSENTYSAVVVMVILTTMATPPLLKWAMNRKQPDA